MQAQTYWRDVVVTLRCGSPGWPYLFSNELTGAGYRVDLAPLPGHTMGAFLMLAFLIGTSISAPLAPRPRPTSRRWFTRWDEVDH